MEEKKNINKIPLCVDLDGTLLNTDTIVESALLAVKKKPFLLFVIPFWIFWGKNFFKTKITDLAIPDIKSLPYNLPFLEYLKEEKKTGRYLVLTTATTTNIANEIENHLNIFDEVIVAVGYFSWIPVL